MGNKIGVARYGMLTWRIVVYYEKCFIIRIDVFGEFSVREL